MYAKLFTSIYQGTLRGNSHGLLVFTNLLAHCDKHGYADMHPRAIAEEVGLTVEQVRAALDTLEAADSESRSPELEGRRIVRMDEHRAWGWLVVNYVKYRSIRDEDDRREQNRMSQEKWRNKHKPQSAAVSRSKPQSAHTEAEAYTDTELGGQPPITPLAPAAPGVATQPPTPTALPGPAPRKRSAKPVEPPKSAETWAAYSQAYKERYKVEPVRNAKVNSQISQLVDRLGAEEAPFVAQSYLSNRNSLYVAAKHCCDLLLRDAEKLRTEWLTGNVTHQRDAHEVDRLASTGAMWDRVGQRLREKGIE